ncbi:MAG: hypothetical protein NTV88_05240 [Candidatus Micrarchaeota archaeon]|nr:hypothetical protein [Candidatus Micrarchaeota archaeon]
MFGKTTAIIVLFALALFAGTVTAACASYGEPVVGACCPGLQPDSKGYCNQPTGMCSLDSQWHPKPINPQASGATGTAQGAFLNAQNGLGLIGSATPLYSVGWFSDWRITSIIGVSLAIAIISLAAIVGNALNLPEVKAFVDAELSQCIVSVILIISIVGAITFYDELARAAIGNGRAGVDCANTSVEPCYIKIATDYLDNLYNTGSMYARDSLADSYMNQNLATTGANIMSQMSKALFAGISVRPLAGMSIQAERGAAVFDNMSKMLVSIVAQRYFLDVITFAIAPILLLFGILLRTFFFTRKLGGLLLAIALSLFIIYPTTYALSWYTLQVNLYGDRTVAIENSCPAECSIRAPVAFYINETGNGQIVTFQKTQDIKSAGITKDNWATGDINNDGTVEFPGLVACTDLSTTLTGGASPPVPQCDSSCPEHCREVPIPSQFPDCKVSACASCNAGCKIIRQRTDCNVECDSTCSAECKTALPVENKCYTDYDTGPTAVVAADLEVSCSGCSGCPDWCKIRKPNGDLVYNDAECNIAACKPPPTEVPGSTGTCPSKCVYVSAIGGSFDCGTQCTGCPEPCRLRTPSGSGSYADLVNYDLDGSYAAICGSTAVQTACSSCPVQCKNKMSADPITSGCAPYPTNPPTVSECTSCPDYCRFSDYNFIHTGSPLNSATQMSSGIPAVCTGAGIKCSTSSSPPGSTPECDAGCKLSSVNVPPICLPYDATSTDPSYCKMCQPKCRTTTASTDPDCTGYECSIGNCGAECRSDTPAQVPVCNAYVGFGQNPSTGYTDAKLYGCYGSISCEGITDQISCYMAAGGCQWGLPTHCYGPVGSVCLDSSVKYNEGACKDPANKAKGCIWATRGNQFIPISIRDGPVQEYKNSLDCGQCPENCRIGSENDCGLKPADNQYTDANGVHSNAIYDCSFASCSTACRQSPQKTVPPATPVCRDYAPPNLPCTGCSAICRRPSGTSNPKSVSTNYCTLNGQANACKPYDAGTGTGCTDSCLISPAPAVACQECFNCKMDCLYKPAVRTDCSQACSDQNLVGALTFPDQAVSRDIPGAAEYSMSDVRNAGVFMLPAMVLPLLNIVIVIAFIRVFSPTLGGDIEIPGLSRIL